MRICLFVMLAAVLASTGLAAGADLAALHAESVRIRERLEVQAIDVTDLPDGDYVVSKRGGVLLGFVPLHLMPWQPGPSPPPPPPDPVDPVDPPPDPTFPPLATRYVVVIHPPGLAGTDKAGRLLDLRAIWMKLAPGKRATLWIVPSDSQDPNIRGLVSHLKAKHPELALPAVIVGKFSGEDLPIGGVVRVAELGDVAGQLADWIGGGK